MLEGKLSISSAETEVNHIFRRSVLESCIIMVGCVSRMQPTSENMQITVRVFASVGAFCAESLILILSKLPGDEK